MTAAGPGPKMVLDQVEAAERVVADAVQQMQAVSQQLQAQAGVSLTAMKAPAGQITRATMTHTRAPVGRWPRR